MSEATIMLWILDMIKLTLLDALDYMKRMCDININEV